MGTGGAAGIAPTAGGRAGGGWGGRGWGRLGGAGPLWGGGAGGSPGELRHPPVPAQASPAADALLVLGGAMQSAQPPEQPHLGFGSAAERVWHAAALYRAGKARWVLLSGGSQPGQVKLAPEAEAMAEVLRALGVPASAMRLEGGSRITRENAVLSVPLVRQVGARRVLVVTSALHMPRALETLQMAFAGSGVTFLPASTDAEALGNVPDPWAGWWPEARSLEWSSRSIKEHLGLAQVWMMRLMLEAGA